MAESKYYDGTKLLSLMDVDGNKPELYICTSNRSAGKTTYFGRLCVNRFLKNGEKFCLLYRFKYELNQIADKFFKDIATLFFPGWWIRSESRADGIYHELYIGNEADDPKKGGVSCGYALSMNSADQLKKMSHLLSDTKRILFDEFQSETNTYCANEVDKFISIHTSIARGNGEQVRYVPVYMISNPVTLLNPYYVAMNIAPRLRDDTKFLRGQGFVLEQGYNDVAATAQMESGFNRAFATTKQVAYLAQGVYLNDNKVFIDKPHGRSKYLATIRCFNKDYGIRMFPEDGVVYCDNRPDNTFPVKLAVTTDDHNVNYVMLKAYAPFIEQMRYYFDRGCFRFKDLQAKEAILQMLSY